MDLIFPLQEVLKDFDTEDVAYPDLKVLSNKGEAGART